MRTPRTPKAKMGTSQRSASLPRYSQCSSSSSGGGSQTSNESETLESAFIKAKQDMLLLVQDELLLKKDIQDVQSLFSKIMSQLGDIDSNRRNNTTSDASSIECSETYARTNLNQNHQTRVMKLGLGLPPLQLDKYRIPVPASQSSRFHDDESSSSYSQTESSLYPSDCALSDTDYSQTSSASSSKNRSSRSRGRKNTKRMMNKTYVIEPATKPTAEPSILDKSTYFDQTDLRSYNGFMPVLSSTFAANITQHTNIEPCADDAGSPLLSAVSLKRHLRNKHNNASQSEKSLNATARQNLRQKGILKNSSYYQACSTSLQVTESDTPATDLPRNDVESNESFGSDGNTTLGTRPSPLGANSFELTQNNTTLRQKMKVRFEDMGSSSVSSSDSSSSQTNSCAYNDKPRVKRFSKKPPTPMRYTQRSKNSTDSSSDSEKEQLIRKKTVRRQVSFADSVQEQCATPSDIGSPYFCESDTSLWLENSNEVFVDYETERQARFAAMDTTKMVEFDDSTETVESEVTNDGPMLKLPWLPQLVNITEDSFKAVMKELEKCDNNLELDNNMTYNDNFALIAHIEKEFKKCRENGNEAPQDRLNVSRQSENYACSEDYDIINNVEMPLNVSLNDSFPKHQHCVDHDVHLALGEPCSFFLEDTLMLLENSKLLELHLDQLSESGFESTHTLNSSIDSSQTDSSSIGSASQKQLSFKPDTVKPKMTLRVPPPSLEVTRDSTPDITSVQSPEETACMFEGNVHTMCEMNFQGAPQTDYCESLSSSAYSSSSGMGSHNSSQSSNIAISAKVLYNTPVTSAEPTPDTTATSAKVLYNTPVTSAEPTPDTTTSSAKVLYNTPVTSAEPTPDTTAHDSSKLIAPYGTPASTCTSFSADTNESSTTTSGTNSDDVTLMNPPQSQTLFNLGISPISSKESRAPSAVTAPMNSPCVSEDEEETITQNVIAGETSPQTLRKQLFPSPDGPASPIILQTKRRGQKLARGSIFKIVHRSNSKARGKKSSSESEEKTTTTTYKKRKDIKQKLKVFSNLFHRKDKDSLNQIKTLAHI